MSDAEYNPYAPPTAGPSFAAPLAPADSHAQAVAGIRSRRTLMTGIAWACVAVAAFESLLLVFALGGDEESGRGALDVSQLFGLLGKLGWVLWLYATAELIYPLRESTYAKPRHPLFWHHVIPFASIYLCFKDIDGLWNGSTIPQEERSGLSFETKWTLVRVYWVVKFIGLLIPISPSIPIVVFVKLVEMALSIRVIYTLTMRATAFANQRIQRGGIVYDGNLYGY
jgi:hypothetical protein